MLDSPTDVSSASELLQLLRDGTPRTRSELATRTSLSRSTITQRVDELMKVDLIAPVETAVSTGGRPSARFQLNTVRWLIVALDLGATHCTVGLTTLNGEVIASEHYAVDIAIGPEPILDEAIDRARGLIATVERSENDVAAVGVGLPGPVAFATGRPENPPIMPGWHHFDTPGYIRRSLDVPILVDNDVNVAALGERAREPAAWDDMIFVKVATGIGAGIVSGGLLQRGANGIAGNIGHVKVSTARNIQCQCGNVDCLEANAGGPAIITQLRAKGIEASSSADIVRLARTGNLEAARILRDSGRMIGEVLTMCVSVTNPAVIVIGGSISASGEHLLAGIREVVYANSVPLAAERLVIVQSRAKEDAGVIGAGILAANHVLSVPYVEEQLRALRAEGAEPAAAPPRR